jgi:hypothetical protein
LSTQHLHVVIPCIVALAGAVALTNESSAATRHHGRHLDRDFQRHSVAPEQPRDVAPPDSREVADGAGPHRARGRDTASAGRHSFSGLASYYSGRGRVASGGSLNASGYTCAHRTLPFGTHLRVADPRSGRSVVVTVTRAVRAWPRPRPLSRRSARARYDGPRRDACQRQRHVKPGHPSRRAVRSQANRAAALCCDAQRRRTTVWRRTALSENTSDRRSPKQSPHRPARRPARIARCDR